MGMASSIFRLIGRASTERYAGRRVGGPVGIWLTSHRAHQLASVKRGRRRQEFGALNRIIFRHLWVAIEQSSGLRWSPCAVVRAQLRPGVPFAEVSGTGSTLQDHLVTDD